LPVILFLISLIIAASVTVVIFVVYFEQKILENNRLREARRAAEQSNAAKSEFLAAMSHEIRTPMNAVLGMNEMVLAESRRTRDDLPKDRERIRQVLGDITAHAENIDSAGKSLISIINDILDFSKIEAGKMEIREDRYELSSVLNDVSNMIVFRAQAKGLKYLVEVDEDLPDALYGDAVRVRQIILNVLNNAVKYTRAGSVSLLVEGRAAAADDTQTVAADDYHTYRKDQLVDLKITVRDTGIGIKEEDLPRLFGQFERMDLEQNNTIEGTGLGLAITRKLLDLMHGSVEVKSQYGKGSEFTLHLPQRIISPEPIGNFRRRFEQNREAARSTEETFLAPDARVLIVDDTQMNLMVAEGLLKDTGIAIDTATSGADALAFTQRNIYDLILMDQRMPGMDGVETLQRIRAQETKLNRSPVPVVCLTADAIAGARQRYVEQGFTDYLSKPIDRNALYQMVRSHLPADKVRDAADGINAQQEEDAAPGSGEDLFDALRKAGVDPEQGLRYTGNQEEFYRSLLSEYVKKAPERSERLREYYTERDIANYAILVHSMKSTARTIGADALGAQAEKLQNAADAGDWSYIDREHAGFLTKYDAVYAAIEGSL
ncbi:MAG: response regulator, partial [Lachnospiraceae bacterium]|nr:response regulator [Lachnospiraceae bacterium]